MSCNKPGCVEHIIRPFITKKGKRIYPKHGKYFSFCTEGKEKATPVQSK